MNEKKLIEHVIGQIKEAQLKLGYEREVIRLYFPVPSLNRLLGTDFEDAGQMAAALGEAEPLQNSVLGPLVFLPGRGRIEVQVPPEGAAYVAEKMPDPEFLKALIALFASHHHLTAAEIRECFERSGRAYSCERMAAGADFDYVFYFEDPAYDAYVYCIKMEMDHTIYHRFTREDYADVVD